MTAIISIPTSEGDGAFDAYIAAPGGGSASSAIVVIQEIFGINAGIRRKCDQLAEAGYLAMAPDLFWRLEPGIELDPDIPDQFEAALGWMGKFDQDMGIRDIEATIRAARDRVGGGKVGAVGYCLGGRLAYMTAARTDVDASAAIMRWDRRSAQRETRDRAAADAARRRRRPFCNPDVQAKMHEGLDDHPRDTLHDYPGVDHGFATEFGQRRVDDAAILADERTMAFFRENL